MGVDRGIGQCGRRKIDPIQLTGDGCIGQYGGIPGRIVSLPRKKQIALAKEHQNENASAGADAKPSVSNGGNANVSFTEYAINVLE